MKLGTIPKSLGVGFLGGFLTALITIWLIFSARGANQTASFQPKLPNHATSDDSFNKLLGTNSKMRPDVALSIFLTRLAAKDVELWTEFQIRMRTKSQSQGWDILIQPLDETILGGYRGDVDSDGKLSASPIR
jgi:hypothetical protein